MFSLPAESPLQESDTCERSSLHCSVCLSAPAAARLKVAGPVLQKSCPQLKQKQATAGAAIKTVLAPFSPEGWCQAMMRKPQSAWSMADANQFVKLCTGVKAS